MLRQQRFDGIGTLKYYPRDCRILSEKTVSDKPPYRQCPDLQSHYQVYITVSEIKGGAGGGLSDRGQGWGYSDLRT